MLINYRTLSTVIAGAIFNFLVSIGVVDIPSETILAAVNTVILILAAIFRYYAGRKLFSKKVG